MKETLEEQLARLKEKFDAEGYRYHCPECNEDVNKPLRNGLCLECFWKKPKPSAIKVYKPEPIEKKREKWWDNEPQ